MNKGEIDHGIVNLIRHATCAMFEKALKSAGSETRARANEFSRSAVPYLGSWSHDVAVGSFLA